MTSHHTSVGGWGENARGATGRPLHACVLEHAGWEVCHVAPYRHRLYAVSTRAFVIITIGECGGRKGSACLEGNNPAFEFILVGLPYSVIWFRLWILILYLNTSECREPIGFLFPLYLIYASVNSIYIHQPHDTTIVYKYLSLQITPCTDKGCSLEKKKIAKWNQANPRDLQHQVGLGYLFIRRLLLSPHCLPALGQLLRIRWQTRVLTRRYTASAAVDATRWEPGTAGSQSTR